MWTTTTNEWITTRPCDGSIAADRRGPQETTELILTRPPLERLPKGPRFEQFGTRFSGWLQRLIYPWRETANAESAEFGQEVPRETDLLSDTRARTHSFCRVILHLADGSISTSTVFW